jgi:hypothetical protein
MFQKIDQESNKWSLLLFVMAVVALATSFFLRTPELSKKAETLQTVQTKVIPALKAKAGCEKWRADVATRLALQPDMVDPSMLPKECQPVKVK